MMTHCLKHGREPPPVKQDSFWSWFICVCTATCMALSIGFIYAMGVLFPVLMDTFHENRERTAWVSSIAFGLFCFLGPLTGAFVNRFGFRLCITVGCLTCAVALFLGSSSSSLLVMFFVFSVPFAVGTSFIYVSTPIAITRYFTKRRSFALGFLTAGAGLGTMVFGPVVQVMTVEIGWRKALCVLGACLVVASLTGCFLKSYPSGEATKNSSKKFSFHFSLWKNRPFLVMVSLAGLLTFCRVVPYVHLAKYCDDIGIAPDLSSSLFVFVGAFVSFGRIVSGKLSDLSWINSRYLLQSSMLIVGVCIGLLPLAKTYGALVAFAIIFGTADGMVVTSHIIQLLESAHETKKASALGFTMMIAGIFSIGSPPLSGFMADKFGSYDVAFLVAGGITVLGSLLPFVLGCHYSNSKPVEVDLEEIMDKEQNEIGTKAKAALPLIQQSVQAELQQGTVAHRVIPKKHQRPVSFKLAMETPLY